MQLTNEKNQKILKWIIAILLVGFVIYLIVDSFTSKRLGDALNSFLNWMEDNLVLGSFAFAGVYIMCTVLFVPGSALTLGAGFIYGSAVSSSGAGVALGSTVVFFSASVGACVAFFVGRFVMRDCSQRLFDRFKVARLRNRLVNLGTDIETNNVLDARFKNWFQLSLRLQK